jgi:DNA polymerase-3 subunit gamma/tau
MLSTSAFNALLKTLEEPPPHVVFVFATTEVHKIPSTIMSRCQRYDFKLIPTARLVEHLSGILTAEKIAHDTDGLRVVARQAAGSVRDGLSLLDQVIAYVGDQAITGERVAEVLGVADRRLLFQLVEAALARDVGQALRLVTQAVDRGVDLGQLAKAFLAHLHDVEIAGLVAEPGDIIDASADELAEARALAAKAPRGLLGAMFDRWARAVEEAGKSQSPRLILEMALVDLCFAEPLAPLGDLLQRLEEMEARLSAGAPAPAVSRPAPSRSVPAPIPSAIPSSIPSGAPPPSVSPPAARGERGAAPASPQPVEAATSPGEKWRRIRAQFDDRALLAAALDHGEVTEWGEGRLTLVLPDKLTLDQVEKNRKDVERAIVAVSGQPTQLVLRQGIPGAGSAVRSEVNREADAALADQRKRETEARQHPMIKKAQELFGVSAREIKTP